MSIKFTVFTPIFNRKDKIHRVFNSLLYQSYKNFEWVVVDDGSTDNVIDLLYQYKKQAKFPVKIIQQKNSGKHIAWNRAVEVAKGDMFLPADSDDAFEPETLKTLNDAWQEIKQEEKQNFYGIGVLCKDSNTGIVVGEEFPTSPFITNNLDLHFKHKIRGEKWGCIKTDCLRERTFPEIPSTHMPESWIWFWLARKYNIYCINAPLRIYYQNESDNLSRKPDVETMKKRAQINFIYLVWHLNHNFDYIIKYQNGYTILRLFISFWRNNFYLKKSVLKTMNEFDSFSLKFFLTISIIPGFLFYSINSFRE
jgi:glycosyltransferase involved in cell wall biosynthesis